MKAMILAAGRGERMMPLTQNTPKPLLEVCGKPLIEHAILNLVESEFREIVINISYLGKQIQEYCEDGSKWGCSIQYSDEGTTALETAGGIAYASHLLGDKPFLVINSDVFCGYPLQQLKNKPVEHAHLVMIPNPSHHNQGDFALTDQGFLLEEGHIKYTYSGIGIYHPKLFTDIPKAPLKLRPILNQNIRDQLITGERYDGLWMDIGTPDRLMLLEKHLINQSSTRVKNN